MSKSKPGPSNHPANSPQASSQALLDELRLAADRAREERLKLARLVKHSADLPVNGGTTSTPGVSAPNDAKLTELSQQVERLDQVVSEKLDALEQAQQDIDSRTQYLESLRHTITEATAAFTIQVEQAQHFKAHVDAAKQHVKMSAGQVAEDVRQHLADSEAPIAERLKQLTALDEQIDKRIARMQQMHKQANEAVDKHLLGALRAAKEQAADLAGPVKAELDRHLHDQQAQIGEAIQARIAELDVDVDEALSPLTDRFNQIVGDAQARADELAGALPARLEEQVQQQMNALREAVAKQAEEIATGQDEKTLVSAQQIMRDKVAQALDAYLSEAEDDAGGYVEGLIAKLDDARIDALGRYEQLIEKIEQDRKTNQQQTLEQFRQQLRDAVSEYSIEPEQAIAKIDAEFKRLGDLADQRVEKAQQVIEQTADHIHRSAATAVDAAIKVSDRKLEEYQTNALTRLQAIDDEVEDGIEESRQRLAGYEKTTRRFEDEALRMAESAIAEAQQRLAGFESGITQRIALATNSTNETIAAVDGRLNKVEQDAAMRVTKIVELAESSGKAVAESIDALAKSAEQTAARAQADLDDKLREFEDISAEALRQAEATLRGNIGELRDASRSMIEVVARQVKAQASHIEPQTREVVDQAEQTLRRRIGELRDGAQSMVDLAVSRLEAQLNEVKRKAQHAAFQGVTPDEPASKKANDAA